MRRPTRGRRARSPWQPWFFDWAFNLERGPKLAAKWALIPEGTHVLITPGPPTGHGDRTVSVEDVGCADLGAAVVRIRPQAHVFGHIHEGYGVTVEGTTTYLNACTCDVPYRPAARLRPRRSRPPRCPRWECGGAK